MPPLSGASDGDEFLYSQNDGRSYRLPISREYRLIASFDATRRTKISQSPASRSPPAQYRRKRYRLCGEESAKHRPSSMPFGGAFLSSRVTSMAILRLLFTADFVKAGHTQSPKGRGYS